MTVEDVTWEFVIKLFGVVLPFVYFTSFLFTVNSEPWTLVRNNVSNWVLIDDIVHLNPAPLVISLSLALSIVNTSPTWYPVPRVEIVIPLIAPATPAIVATVIEATAPVPLPVKDLRGTSFIGAPVTG